MKLERLFLGAYVANCYVVWDEANQEAMIIDPGAGASEILKWLAEQGLKVKLIVLTHRHPDHIGAVKELKDATGAELAIHADDAPRPRGDRPPSLSPSFGGQPLPTPDRLLKDDDTIKVGSVRLKVIHTPGHTQGGICLLLDGILLSGDTLFNGSVGRSDMPGGNGQQLIDAIMTKLMTLPDDTLVLPGHGPETTIGAERENNPFLRG
ncbi:MAG: MBL fold metallo-hydrolase [Chloroflexi bacterium]|nr:MBL fold metallo-hydrolase [Chloroflexota bacterium]